MLALCVLDHEPECAVASPVPSCLTWALCRVKARTGLSRACQSAGTWEQFATEFLPQLWPDPLFQIILCFIISALTKHIAYT